jgi:hypothetical protein
VHRRQCTGGSPQEVRPISFSERDRRLGDMLGQAPGAEAAAEGREALFEARAEAAREAKLAGYKSPLRRLIERLLGRRPEADEPDDSGRGSAP